MKPNLDTWTKEEPNARDPWAVLATGATLNLARRRTEAEGRAHLAHRERALALAARQGAADRGGYAGDGHQMITYTGADGKQRTTDMHGVIRTAHNGGAPATTMPAEMVNLR